MEDTFCTVVVLVRLAQIANLVGCVMPHAEMNGQLLILDLRSPDYLITASPSWREVQVGTHAELRGLRSGYSSQ